MVRHTHLIASTRKGVGAGSSSGSSRIVVNVFCRAHVLCRTGPDPATVSTP